MQVNDQNLSFVSEISKDNSTLQAVSNGPQGSITLPSNCWGCMGTVGTAGGCVGTLGTYGCLASGA